MARLGRSTLIESLTAGSPTGTLGERLREARLRLGMSQRDLAEASGVSQQVIHLIESNKVKVTAQAPYLAKALGTPLEWLLFGEGWNQASEVPKEAQRFMVRFKRAAATGALGPKQIEALESILDCLIEAEKR